LVAALVLTVVYLLLTRTAPLRVSGAALFATALLAGWVHLAMDACAWEGMTLLWPFSSRRIAADWLANVDPWIIAVFIAAILLPELFRLVSDEIGAKDKSPRGRLGAIVGFVFVILYVGVRATYHSNVLDEMQARTYRGESPRRAAAFPESASLFSWHGIVETSSALHELNVNAAPGGSFDPESGVTLFKPEASPMLDRARDSDAAKKFLSVARFPKATVEKTSTGFEVQLRDLRYAATVETRREIAVLVKLDSNGNLVDDSLVWARDLHRR
jgi:LexA-binding, inner membrane-associated putative hydrolase